MARVMVGEGEEWTRSFRHDTTELRHSVGRARFSMGVLAL